MDVGTLVARAARRYADRVALDGPQGRQTYAELGDRVARLARGLLALGLNPGDRVLDLQPNQNNYVETDLAAATAGLTRVALNHRLHPDDWARIADDSGATALIYDARYAEPAQSLRASMKHVVVIGDGPGRCYERVMDQPATPLGLDVAPDSLVSLNYTSGSTGHPKGVRRTHRNRFASLVAMTFDVLGGVPAPTDVYLHAGPITHTSGLFVLPFLAAGAGQLIHPRYDPEAVLEAVETHGVTHTAVVPTMIARLLALPEVTAERMTGLKMLGYAGAPMPPEQIRQAYQRITPNLVQYYGLVEAMPPVTVLDAADHAAGLTDQPELLTSAGRPCFGVELRVVDDAGRSLPPGEIGEVVTRGDHVMGGYWSATGDAARAVRDGWLHTGDLGRLTVPVGGASLLSGPTGSGAATTGPAAAGAGPSSPSRPSDPSGPSGPSGGGGGEERLWLVDRKGDMIITGGYNVYPREVEDVIAEVPGVGQVAVVGVSDPEWGQRIVALYTGQATEETVAEHCRTRLAGYKKPKQIRRVTDFPLNATGKIAKSVLRTQLSTPTDATPAQGAHPTQGADSTQDRGSGYETGFSAQVRTRNSDLGVGSATEDGAGGDGDG